MSIDLLTSSASTVADEPARRSYAWLLPVGLIVGFLLIFALLFGQRLIPATPVKTSQVITLRVSSESADDQQGSPPADLYKPSGESKPATIPTKATKGALLFQASGWIEPDPYTTYVPALINGIIDRVYVLEGQAVKKGELLATLIDDDAKLKLKNAKQKIISLEANIAAHCIGADIARAEINAAKKKIEASKALYADAEDNLKRLEKLPLEAIPEQQVVQARLSKIRHEALVAEVETLLPKLQSKIQQIALERIAMTSVLDELRVARDEANLELERTKITSPIDGIVLKLHVAPGKKRMLNMDDPDSAVVVALYQPDKLQARIDVALGEAAGLQIGQIVELSSDILPNQVFTGQVTRVRGEADIQRNTLQAKVQILNPDHRLRPEMLVRAKFFKTTGGNANTRTSGKKSTGLKPSVSSNRLALFVDEKAIVDGTSVWVVSADNTAELRQISPGTEIRDGHQRVFEGLKSGEQVILPPHDDLQSGSRVEITTTNS